MASSSSKLDKFPRYQDSWEDLRPPEPWDDVRTVLGGEGYELLPPTPQERKPSWLLAVENLSKYSQPAQTRKLYRTAVDSEGRMVTLIRIDISDKSAATELEIMRYLNSRKLRHVPENHCVEILKKLQVVLPHHPDAVILVTPPLRKLGNPAFATVGEIVHFFGQIFEGVKFMHDHGVVHLSFFQSGFASDSPLYPDTFYSYVHIHDADPDGDVVADRPTRSSDLTRYSFMDLGRAKFVPGAEYREGQYQLSPIQSGEVREEFRKDISWLGFWLECHFLDRYSGLGFMRPLIQAMTDINTKRAGFPSMNSVIYRFANICSELSKSKLRSKLIDRSAPGLSRTVSSVKSTASRVFSRRDSTNPLLTTLQAKWKEQVEVQAPLTASETAEEPFHLLSEGAHHSPSWGFVNEAYNMLPGNATLIDAIIALTSYQLEANSVVERTLQVLQEVIDEPSSTPELRSNVLRLLLRSCNQFKLLPPSFYLHHVVCQTNQPSGSGGFSDVYRGTWQGQEVALKVFKVFRTQEEGQEAGIYSSFLREIVIWRQLKHPCIQPFLGVEKKRFAPRIATVSKWEHRGNVNEETARLLRQSTPIPYDSWISGMSEGLTYLHGQHVVHGDVRGANLLVDEFSHVRLTDFGLASLVDAHTRTLGDHFGLTVRWAAPELLEDENLKRPNFACDVYSFACTCIEIYSHEKPFNSLPNDVQVINKVVNQRARPQRPRFMPTSMWDLVQLCWHQDPEERPDMSKVVREIWKFNH